MSVRRAATGIAVLAISGLSILTVSSPATAGAGMQSAPIAATATTAVKPHKTKYKTCPRGKYYAPRAGCVRNNMSTDKNTYKRGAKGTATELKFQPGTASKLYISGRQAPIGSYVTNKRGVTRGSFTIPANLPPGTYTLTWKGTSTNGQPTTVTKTIRVYK